MNNPELVDDQFSMPAPDELWPEQAVTVKPAVADPAPAPESVDHDAMPIDQLRAATQRLAAALAAAPRTAASAPTEGAADLETPATPTRDGASTETQPF